MQYHLFWKQISVSQFIMSSPRNIDLFLSDDVISWSGETDIFKEKVSPRKSDLFPHFSKKALSWKRETDISGERARWLLLGYCKTSDSVRMACKKSCGSCTDNGGNGGNGGGNGGSGNSGDCVDERKECPEWAGMGHCSLSETVKNACRKSCNPSCSKNEMCKDEDHDCGDWASAGHCVTNPTVKRLCPRSCDNCNGRPTYPPTQRPNPTVTVPTTPSVYRRYLGYGKLCIDDDSRCPYWKSIGECQRNPSWMNRHCMITCGVSKCDSGVQRPPGSCSNPLGLSYDGTGNFKIPDSAFSSRTDFHPGRGWVASAANARLYMPDNSTSKRIGSWCSNSYDDAKTDFLQVDLGQMRTITYIATQGRYKYFERVSKFKIEYSTDGRSFTPYIQDGSQKVFDGNCDHVTPVLNQFKHSIRARYIKYNPVEYNFACVRMELYGC